MTEVKGFFYPRTAGGRSSLIPSPPWYYSGDLLTVEYRTDPARVAELLPAPLELAEEDPGAVALIWADWQSCSSSREELLDPVRSQYKEAFVVVRCSFQGQTFSRCVYIWVDKDFAIARGIHQGYPKKLGSMWQTRPHPFAQGAPQVGAGGVFGATLAAGDRRLAEAVLTLREESETNGFVNSHPMAHHRIYPGIEARRPRRLRRADRVRRGEFEAGPAWTGDVEVRLFESPTEELSRLEVDEIIGGYYRQVGVEWDGGRVTGDADRRRARLSRLPDEQDNHGYRRPSVEGDRGRHPALDRRASGSRRPPHSPTSRRSTRRASPRSPPAARHEVDAPSRRRGRPSRPGPRCPSPSGPRILRRGRRRHRRAGRGPVPGRDPRQRLAAALPPPRGDAPRRA